MNAGKLDNKPWYIKITTDNYDLLNKWFGGRLYRDGICGMYLTNTRLVKGHTEGQIKGTWGTFDKEITLEEFKFFILKENKIYECWS